MLTRCKNRAFWVVAVDFAKQFPKCTLKYGWLNNTVKKKNSKRRLPPSWLFCNHGPPTKSTWQQEVYVKISCRSINYFQRYGHLNILQIWLKTLIPTPKIWVFGVLTPKHYFWSPRYQKGTSLRETASSEPLCVKIGSAIFALGDSKNKLDGARVHISTKCFFTCMWNLNFVPLDVLELIAFNAQKVGVTCSVIYVNYNYNENSKITWKNGSLTITITITK